MRQALYMPSLSAARHNPAAQALYLRLRKRGKSGKSAVCACAHKLLRQMFGVVKSGVAYDPARAAARS